MAITTTSPTEYAGSWLPSCNDMIFTATSDQTTQPDFYYLIDVLINDAAVITLRRYPVISQTVSVNVREIVESYITSTFDNSNAAGSIFFSTEYVKVTIQATEYYSGQTYSSATATPAYVWNAAAPFKVEKANGVNKYHRQFNFIRGALLVPTQYARPMGYNQVADPTDITMSGADFIVKPEALAVAYPMNVNFKRPVTIFSYFNGVYEANAAALYSVFLGCDETGKVLKKFVEPTNATRTEPTESIITTVMGSLNPADFTYKYAVAGESIFTNMDGCAYVVFYFAETYTTGVTEDKPVSKPLVFKQCHCPEAFAVLYKSYEGGWNMVQCNRRAVETTAIETTTRENVKPTTWNESSRLISSVNVQALGSWKLNTDWVNEAINKDINDMLQSPSLYIMHYHDGELEYIPVTLANANYVTKQHNDVNLFSYTLEFAESYFKNTIKK